MTSIKVWIVFSLAFVAFSCNDGSGGVGHSGTGGNTTGTGGSTGSGAEVSGSGSGGSIGGSGGRIDPAGTDGGSVGTGGSTTDAGGGTGGSGGSTTDAGGGTGGSGASTTGAGSGGAGGGAAPGSTGGTTVGGLKSGPFKVIVLTTALEYAHDSIPTCLTMLTDLGKATAPERATIPGLAADTTWTVDQIGNVTSKAGYFSEVTPENLKNYELFYSDNPTGKVFTNAPDSAAKKQAFVDYWNNGGAWAGQHSASDFENNNSWSWFQDNIDGAWFVSHNPPGTNGTITWQPDFINHPIVKGLPSPYNSGEEWYMMNRDVSQVKGFQVLGKVAVSSGAPRPAVWITENANGKGGRAFYTIKGHSPSTYAEAPFRQLMLRGILWSVHRLPGGK